MTEHEILSKIAKRLRDMADSRATNPPADETAALVTAAVVTALTEVAVALEIEVSPPMWVSPSLRRFIEQNP